MKDRPGVKGAQDREEILVLLDFLWIRLGQQLGESLVEGDFFAAEASVADVHRGSVDNEAPASISPDFQAILPRLRRARYAEQKTPATARIIQGKSLERDAGLSPVLLQRAIKAINRIAEQKTASQYLSPGSPIGNLEPSFQGLLAGRIEGEKPLEGLKFSPLPPKTAAFGDQTQRTASQNHGRHRIGGKPQRVRAQRGRHDQAEEKAENGNSFSHRFRSRMVSWRVSVFMK
jgi:hypothetical protein